MTLLNRYAHGIDDVLTLRNVEDYIMWKYFYGPFGAPPFPEDKARKAEEALCAARGLVSERREKLRRNWAIGKVALYCLVAGYIYARYLPHGSWINPVIENVLGGVFLGATAYLTEMAVAMKLPIWHHPVRS